MARANKLTLKQYMSNINFEQTDKATELNTEPGSVQCLQSFISAFINQRYWDFTNHTTAIYHIYLRYLSKKYYWSLVRVLVLLAGGGMRAVISTALNTITEYIQNSHRNTRGAITHQPAPSPGTIALNIKMCAEYLYHNFLCQTKMAKLYILMWPLKDI